MSKYNATYTSVWDDSIEINATMENGVYKSFIDGELILTITDLGNNIFRAVNKFTDMTAEIIPLDDYRTQIRCIEHKIADKNGHYRKTKKLMKHDTSWLCSMVQEKGFIRKSKQIWKEEKVIL